MHGNVAFWELDEPRGVAVERTFNPKIELTNITLEDPVFIKLGQ